MVAYSFHPRFVEPIRRGLISPYPDQGQCHPKRQTIRADRRRHARPGEEMQLYCGMRTKKCFLIGRAQCVSVEPIGFLVRNDRLIFDVLDGEGATVTNKFARADGFADAKEMHEFWRDKHGLGVWRGVIIRWEPLP